MSGHSKWSTIKRKKGAADAKRSKIFSKIIKEMTIAIKEGGPDPEGNPRLRLAIANAKGVNMPKDNIQRAINKAKDKDSAVFQEVTYEGYAPNGVAVFVECTTDNLQRTVSAIRSYFNKYNGSLGTNGSLSFIFERKGIFTVPVGSIDPEEFEMEAIDGGAEDIVLEEGYFTITTAMEDFGRMQKKLEELGVEAESAGLQRIPNTTVKLDVDSGRKVMKLIDVFEDDDDVSQVFHNLEITDELADALDE
ncbi:MAG TPA: YebC/PmpR family DNA-binding transcriptional regulator [Bacteroidales bacterium]|nr:YebC/PmpR family DNA-binding transcriptional regulator [Bacteroidales bacterium]HRZ76349.1 YebC/PmpR family DNA-binding transcriptional regulator [Bacteroidales bacterium]